MRIIRFIDDQGTERWGYDRQGNSAALQAHDPLGGLSPTDARSQVSQLLAPVVPRAILCIGLLELSIDVIGTLRSPVVAAESN